jgi:hypothetical protein
MDNPVVPTGIPCVGASQFYHRFRGEVDRSRGPVELVWEDGQTTTIEANADWTLAVSPRPWADPFVGAGESELRALEDEVGVWIRGDRVDDEPLAVIIGHAASGSAPILDEVGQFVGLQIAFDDVEVQFRVVAGEVQVEVFRV